MELNIFFIYLTLNAYLEKRPILKGVHYAHKKSRWNLIIHVTWSQNYCTAGTTVLENIAVKIGKKHSHNKVSYNYLGCTIQADHYSRRSQYLHIFFILFIVVSVEENSRKPLLLVTYRNQIFLYFHY